MQGSTRRGFTLIEVMVVLVLLSILGAFARRPMGAFLQNIERRRVVDGIKKMFQTARSRAMADPSIHVGLHVIPAQDSAKALMFLDVHLPVDYIYDPANDTPYKEVFKLPKRFGLSIPTGFPSDVIFRGDGSCQLSGKIVVTSPRGIDTLDILASTGRIQVRR